MKFLGQYKYFFILIPVIFTVFNKEDIILALKVFVISLGLYAILSLTIFAGFLQIANSNSLVPEGFMPYAVVTVYMALNTLFAFFFFLKSSSKKEKYLFFAIFILSLFALLVNNGRIGQLSFIATLFVLVIYYKDYFLQYKKTFFSFIVLIIVIVSSAYSFNKFDRYFKGFKELKIAISEDKYVGSFGARAYLWEVAYNNIPKNHIFGTGVGDDFDDIVEYYENNNPKRLLHPIVGYHNNHFLYLAKFGLFGYILFIVSIYFLLKSLYKNSKDYFVFGIILISMVFFNSFGNVILHYKPFNNVYVVLFLFFAILGKNINKVKI